MVEEQFIHAGDKLQLAVNDLHGQVNSASIADIKDLIRKGFHLSEPEYDTVVEKPPIALAENPENININKTYEIK